jgi:ornithine carbamoyltransferase
MGSYLTELDRGPDWTLDLLDRAADLKLNRGPRNDLAGKSVALFFAKPSVRTRVSFTIGVQELGGAVVELSPGNTKVGKGEHPEDFASVLGRYVHLIVARVFEQSMLDTFAQASGVPVINALSDGRHPCQALADALTLRERGRDFDGLVFCFIGEGNNVAASTGLLLAALGAQVRVVSPAGYGLPAEILEQAEPLAGSVRQLEAVDEAVRGADVLYTDTWVSMGQEDEAKERQQRFASYRIDDRVLGLAASDALVMHCLPAVRGQEIERDVMYGPRSAIWDQAENRLHVQKALMIRALGGA